MHKRFLFTLAALVYVICLTATPVVCAESSPTFDAAGVTFQIRAIVPVSQADFNNYAKNTLGANGAGGSFVIQVRQVLDGNAAPMIQSRIPYSAAANTGQVIAVRTDGSGAEACAKCHGPGYVANPFLSSARLQDEFFPGLVPPLINADGVEINGVIALCGKLPRPLFE